MRLVAVALALFALAGTAQAYTQHKSLNDVASIFAQRPVKVLCYDLEEQGSPNLFGAWGYVKKPLGKAKKAHLDLVICNGALNVNDQSIPAWQRALGVSVLIHESYHLRRWGAAGDEAKVECKAIRHFRTGARLLGATEETVEELWPAALAAHYELAEYESIWDGGKKPYYDPNCNVPRLHEDEEE